MYQYVFDESLRRRVLMTTLWMCSGVVSATQRDDANGRRTVLDVVASPALEARQDYVPTLQEQVEEKHRAAAGVHGGSMRNQHGSVVQMLPAHHPTSAQGRGLGQHQHDVAEAVSGALAPVMRTAQIAADGTVAEFHQGAIAIPLEQVDRTPAGGRAGNMRHLHDNDVEMLAAQLGFAGGAPPRTSAPLSGTPSSTSSLTRNLPVMVGRALVDVDSTHFLGSPVGTALGMVSAFVVGVILALVVAYRIFGQRSQTSDNELYGNPMAASPTGLRSVPVKCKTGTFDNS